MAVDEPESLDGCETLAFFIEDARYTVPTLQFRGCPPNGVARLAERLLRESAHHRAVEVRRDDKIIYAARRHLLAGAPPDEAG